MQKNEYLSSPNRTDLITFVGFKEYLVINFIKDNLTYNPLNIYIFTSKQDKILNSNKEKLLNETILDRLKIMVHERNEGIKIKEFRTGNLWDIKYYYQNLTKLPKANYIINVSSGPGVYSAASMIWALETDNKISYSIENWHNRELQSAIFRNLNMRPFEIFNFKLDNLDKYIVKALEAGRTNTDQIRKYLKTNLNYEVSLRNIQVHLKKLSESGIIELAGTKTYSISFSDDFRKLGYSVPDYFK